MVSHDRRFLENTVNRVIELAPVYPEGSFQVRGTYSDFLEKKSEYLLQRQNLEERLANKVRRETEWLRRAPKARTTKARFRIEEAGRLQDELGEVRTKNRSIGQVGIALMGPSAKPKNCWWPPVSPKGSGEYPCSATLTSPSLRVRGSVCLAATAAANRP